jgi:hypothetical protein
MHSAIIKSKVSRNKEVAKLSDHEALLYTWALSHTDDYGRIDCDPDFWVLNVAPGRTSRVKVRRTLEKLAELGLIVLYTVEGDPGRFGVFPKWRSHQGFSDKYTLQALYPNPITGEIEDKKQWQQIDKNSYRMTLGEELLKKNGKVRESPVDLNLRNELRKKFGLEPIERKVEGV